MVPRLLLITPSSRASQLEALVARTEPEPIRCLAARDISEALVILSTSPGQAVAMLDMDAAQSHDRMLQELAQNAPDLPVIALIDTHEQGARAMQSGAHAFLRRQSLGRGGVLESMHMAVELHRTRRELDQAREQLIHADRLASLGQLTAGVAHEINNPTAFLLTNLEAMRERLSGAQDQDAALSGADGMALAARLSELAQIVDESLEGVGHLRSIVKDLRNFSRVDSSELGPVDLNHAIEVACRIAHNAILGRARLIKDLEPLPHVTGNHGKLVQVFVNLLTNAAHSISEGAPNDHEIRVSTRARDGQLVAAVEDTGCGIPEDARKRVFEPFYTTKPRDQGNGLGLPLSAEIVRNHGGELTFEPRPGRGTRFEVRLAPSQATSPVHVRMPKRIEIASPKRARVLLVDDEPGMLRAYRRVLAPRHEVVMAASGQQALDILGRDTAFDAVICDFCMPGVDGIMVYEAMRARDPELASRIVFCTGGAVTHRDHAFVRATSNTVLEKPVLPEFLLGAIEQLGKR